MCTKGVKGSNSHVQTYPGWKGLCLQDSEGFTEKVGFEARLEEKTLSPRRRGVGPFQAKGQRRNKKHVVTEPGRRYVGT